MSTKMITPTTAWLIWLVVALFYFYEYILRTAPSVMVPELIQYFHINTTGLGMLIGFFYYSYAPLQLIAGTLLDRFGARYSMSFAVLLCPIGCLLFLDANFYIASLGRFLIGAGSAFAFTGTVYVATQWIPKGKHALVIGATQTLGMLGGIVGQTGMAFLLLYYRWQIMWELLALAGIILFIILFIIIPDQSIDLKEIQRKPMGLFRNLWIALKNPATWICGCLGGLLFSPTIVFVLLWGPSFFIKVYKISTIQTAIINTAVLLGWVVGSPLMGWISDSFQKRKLILIVDALLILILFLFIAYTHIFSFNILMISMFLMGFFSGGQILCFAIAKDANPDYVKGSTIGATNFIVFIWAALLTSLSGVLLNYFHQGGALFSFTPTDYQKSLIIVVMCLILAVILATFLPSDPNKTTTK